MDLIVPAARLGGPHDRAPLAYQPSLSPRELAQVLAELCAKARQTEWLLCRYLADLADDDRYRDLGWYADVYQYSREELGLGAKITRERIRMGRALRELPQVQEAFVAGTLSYSRVRELTRVATAQSEADWLAVARKVSMRELERRVASRLGAPAVCDRPAEISWRTPETVDVSLRMSADAWALVERAMAGARQAAEGSLSDAEALEAVAREALCSLAQAGPTDIADPRKAVVLYQCTECRATELETGAGAMPLSAPAAERLSAGAKRIDLDTEGKCEACVGGTMPAAVRRAVLARDRGQCRFCGRRRYVDVHHIEPRSEGGEHSRENCACACTGCHGAIHEGELRIEGNAEEALRWYDRSGKLLGSEEPGGERADRWRSEHTSAVLAAMKGRGGFHADGLCQSTGLSAAAVAQALFELTAAGEIVEERLGVYASRLAVGHSNAEAEPRSEPAEPAPPGPRCPKVGRNERTLSPRPALALGPPAVCDTLLETLRSSRERSLCSDDLCQATGHGVSQVTVALLELELAGRVQVVAPGAYALASAALGG